MDAECGFRGAVCNRNVESSDAPWYSKHTDEILTDMLGVASDELRVGSFGYCASVEGRHPLSLGRERVRVVPPVEGQGQ